MMVSLKDLEGRYTFVNEAFQKFTGRGEDIVLGKTAADLNDKEFADFIAGEDRAAIESRRVIQREIMTPPEHGARTTLLVKFPVFDEHGEVTGVGTVMTDITEQKHDRAAARPGATDRIARPAHRRDRARLQQPADLDPAQRRRAREPARRQAAPARRGGAHGGRARRRPDAAAARLRTPADAGAAPDQRHGTARRHGAADAPHARRAHRDRASAMPPICGSRPSIPASSRMRCSTLRSMRATRCRTAGKLTIETANVELDADDGGQSRKSRPGNTS